MEMVAIIGVDLAKRSFHVRGAASDGKVLFRTRDLFVRQRIQLVTPCVLISPSSAALRQRR